MSFGPLEIGLIILAALLLFGGYKKLPDASRSFGRSLRIFKGEMKGMKDDDVRTKDAATTTPVRGEIVTQTASPSPAEPSPAAGDPSARLEQEARAAEAQAAELRARAAQYRTTDGSH
jgi:sec-independent protein translocase protein TatA